MTSPTRSPDEIEVPVVRRLLAAAESLSRQLAEARAECRKLRGSGEEWTEEARKAVDELEERFDIAVCSSPHLARFADRAETAERLLAQERGRCAKVAAKEVEQLSAYLERDCQGDDPAKQHGRIYAEGRRKEAEMILAALRALPPAQEG